MRLKHSICHGIIDGCQFHGAITDLMKETPDKWVGFKWKVTVVRPDKSLTQYRQLARLQDERNKALYIYEPTVYDLLHGLRGEYDLLFNAALKNSRTGRRGVKVNHRDVARQYDGAENKTNRYVK